MKYTKYIKLLLFSVMLAFLFSACGAPESVVETTYGQMDNGDNNIENPIQLSQRAERIITIAPSITEVLVALGFGDAIIATDDMSENVAGIAQGISVLTFENLDVEHILYLQPDLIITSDMILFAGNDPLRAAKDSGIDVIYLPTADSIEGIKEDIRFLAELMDAAAYGEAIIAEMEAEISRVRQIGETIAEPRTVYFEISAAPFMFTFGQGTFLHDMIELIGAVNIFGDQTLWVSVTDEVLFDRNPDVILTSVVYIDDPVAEINSRPGWGALNAVQNGDVFYINADSTSRPSHHIIYALREMAIAIYPDYFS
jgi:iron complex transport system substrate-binding protein